MRITCPNCGAQYEVPVEVIPDEGRDVQCSNCGDTWFQAHPDHEIAEAPQELPGGRAAAPDDEDEFAPEPEEAPQDTAGGAPEPEEPEEEDLQPAGDAGIEDAPPPRQPRELDPSVSQILREEAEREVRRRQAQTGGLESQEELGLDYAPGEEAGRRGREARERMARMRGEPAEETEDGARPRNRSRLLPDIEEINSSLQTGSQSSAETPPPVPATRPARSGGFTRGFGVVLIIAVILVVVYVNAAKISAAVPAADSAVTSYVLAVDNLRIWLDSKLSGFIPQ